MKKGFLFCSVLLFLILNSPFLSAKVYNLSIKGVIDSIVEEYISDSFKRIDERGDCELIVISLDTPGGFSTSMRSIIKTMMNSKSPTAVYVSPSGARAASAGFLITIAAHFAAMAPGTNMGAAHPVSVMGKKIDGVMEKKVLNDAVSYVKSIAKSRNRNIELSEKAVTESNSYTSDECLEGNLIDVIAKNIDDLIEKIDGKKIVLDGKEITININNKSVRNMKMTMRQRFLRTITNPNLAYFLLVIGLAGLYIEFTHPGIIIPGVIGGIALLLAFLAFQILPVNYIGLFLIFLSIAFFIAEIKIQGFGVFGIGGVISFFLGSVMLLNSPIPELRPSVATIVAASVSFGSIFLFLAYKIIVSRNKKAETGVEGMIGESGKSKSAISSEAGKVFIKGEIWNAVSDEPIREGEKVKIISVKNLVLKVKIGE